MQAKTGGTASNTQRTNFHLIYGHNQFIFKLSNKGIGMPAIQRGAEDRLSGKQFTIFPTKSTETYAYNRRGTTFTSCH
jgi:hypothetical protein